MFDKCYIRMMPFFRDLFYPTGLNHFLSGPQSGPAELLFAPPPQLYELALCMARQIKSNGNSS